MFFGDTRQPEWGCNGMYKIIMQGTWWGEPQVPCTHAQTMRITAKDAALMCLQYWGLQWMPRAWKRHPLKSVAVNFPSSKWNISPMQHFAECHWRSCQPFFISHISHPQAVHGRTSAPIFPHPPSDVGCTPSRLPQLCTLTTTERAPNPGMGYVTFFLRRTRWSTQYAFDTCRAELMCLDKTTYSLQCGAPLVINWFINPSNYIVISPKNHSYWSYKPT